MSNSNTPDLASRAPRGDPVVLVLFLLLAAYAVFLVANTTTVAGGSDSSGYLNSARLLASGHLQGELRVPAEFGPQSELNRGLFTPVGFFSYPNNALLPPTYPVGLPLHFAVAGKLFGWHLGPLLIEVGAALAALWLCYLTARELGLDRLLAVTGAIILAVCPVFIFTSIQPLSDTLASTWVLASVYTALRARRHIAWAAICGVAVAIAVLVRPTNAVIIPSLIVILGLDWRRLAFAVLGGAPGALWLGYYNHALYGDVLGSGYGDWRSLFDMIYVPGTLLHFAHWLAFLLPAACLILPFFALLVREYLGRVLVALALWCGTIVALYSSYAVSHEVWWCLRFILPAIPAIILASLLGLDALVRRLPPARRPVVLRSSVAFLLLWAAAGSLYWTNKFGVPLTIKNAEQVYEDGGLAARRLLPPDALVVSLYFSGALYAYTDHAILRWDQVKPAEFIHFKTLADRAGRPVCAVLFDVEEKSALQENCPGEWTRIHTVKNVTLWLLHSSASPSVAE